MASSNPRIEKLQQFLTDNPQDSFVQHALALEYIKDEEDDKAQELFLTLLSQNESYVGSYYHLAKLYERKGQVEEAEAWYRKGMEKAKAAGDNHAYNELQAALEDLIY